MTSRIAIIGGGLTGLTAARILSKNGHFVHIYESGPELGGLAASFEIQGEPMEKAYHHLFRTDSDIIELISELGLEDRLEWYDSSVAIYRDGELWPFMKPVDLLRFRPCSFVGRIRLGFVAIFLKYYKNWKSLQSESALVWMRRYCGESATRTVWEPLIRGKFAKDAEVVSMAWLWARLHVRSNSRVQGEKVEKLGYVRGGFVELISALSQEIHRNGATISLNTRVQGLNREDADISVATEDEVSRFDKVLFTGSNPALRKILADEERALITELGGVNYIGAVCLVFESNQKLGDHYWVNVNDQELPFLVFIRHTKLVPAARYNGKEVYYLGAYLPHDHDTFKRSKDEICKQWFLALERMFPEFERQLVTNASCFKFRDAQHIVDNEYQAKILSDRTSIPGLYLSNFSQVFPHDRGTNFAVRDGVKIAKIMLNDLIQGI